MGELFGLCLHAVSKQIQKCMTVPAGRAGTAACKAASGLGGDLKRRTAVCWEPGEGSLLPRKPTTQKLLA